MDFNREGIPSSGEIVDLPIDEGGKMNMDRRIKRRFTSHLERAFKVVMLWATRTNHKPILEDRY